MTVSPGFRAITLAALLLGLLVTAQQSAEEPAPTNTNANTNANANANATTTATSPNDQDAQPTPKDSHRSILAFDCSQPGEILSVQLPPPGDCPSNPVKIVRERPATLLVLQEAQ